MDATRRCHRGVVLGTMTRENLLVRDAIVRRRECRGEQADTRLIPESDFVQQPARFVPVFQRPIRVGLEFSLVCARVAATCSCPGEARRPVQLAGLEKNPSESRVKAM